MTRYDFLAFGLLAFGFLLLGAGLMGSGLSEPGLARDAIEDAVEGARFQLALAEKHRAINNCRNFLGGEPVMGFGYSVVCVRPIQPEGE